MHFKLSESCIKFVDGAKGAESKYVGCEHCFPAPELTVAQEPISLLADLDCSEGSVMSEGFCLEGDDPDLDVGERFSFPD